jgi:hypothetical protein
MLNKRRVPSQTPCVVGLACCINVLGFEDILEALNLIGSSLLNA